MSKEEITLLVDKLKKATSPPLMEIHQTKNIKLKKHKNLKTLNQNNEILSDEEFIR